MPQVRMPDGVVVGFPDDMPADQIRGLIAQKFPQVAQPQPTTQPTPGQPTFDERFSAVQPSAAESALQTLSDATRGVAKGATFSFGDEIVAGMMTPVEMAYGAVTGRDKGLSLADRASKAYNEMIGMIRAEDKMAEARSPVASTIGNIAGGAALGGTLAKGGATLLNAAKPTAPSLIGRGTAEGAAYGAAYGAGEGEGIQDRLTKAGYGALLGGATGGVMGGVAARQASRNLSKAIPATEELRAVADAAYKRADQAGVVIKPKNVQNLYQDVFRTVASEGIDPTLHPGATAALKRLEELTNQPIALKTAEIIRRVFKGAASSINPDERRIASIMIDKMDDFLGSLKPGDIISGDAKAASSALNEAREFWTRFRKGEMIEGMIESAKSRAGQFSVSGMENALRTEFRQLARNPKKMRLFTEYERAAIKRAAQGGTVQNALRVIGKFAPRGVISGGVALGASAMGGPIAGGALMGAGEIAKLGATRMMQGNVNRVSDLVRAGKDVPKMLQLTKPQQALLDAMILVESQQGQRAVNR